MIASMYGLDHRLAELRPTEAELRLARHRRDAADAAGRSAASAQGAPRHARAGVGIGRRPFRSPAV